jgi:hypothetical protein
VDLGAGLHDRLHRLWNVRDVDEARLEGRVVDGYFDGVADVVVVLEAEVVEPGAERGVARAEYVGQPSEES